MRWKQILLFGAGSLVLTGSLLLVALPHTAQPSPGSMGEQAVVFGAVKLRPGTRTHEVESQLRDRYRLESGMPDPQWDRYCWIVHTREPSGEFQKPTSPRGRMLSQPRPGAGTVVFDGTGKITRAWKDWGWFQSEEASSLAYTLIAASKSLGAEGNRQPQIVVKEGRTDNTTLRFDFGGKALELVIYDSPGGSMRVSLREGFSTD